MARVLHAPSVEVNTPQDVLQFYVRMFAADLTKCLETIVNLKKATGMTEEQACNFVTSRILEFHVRSQGT